MKNKGNINKIAFYFITSDEIVGIRAIYDSQNFP